MKYLEEESDRYGFKVFAATRNALEPATPLHELLTNDVDIALVQLPASKQTELHKLHAHGLPFLVADTTLEYAIKLRHPEIPVLENKALRFQAAEGNGDLLPEVLETLLGKTWQKFSGPFAANPYLVKNDPKTGYRNLVQRCAGQQGKSWIMYRHQQPAGFVAGFFNGPGNFEIVEIAVLPEFEKHDLYADAIRFIPFFLHQQGNRVVKVSARVQQLDRQRQLMAAGYIQVKSYLHLHFYPFFSRVLSGENTLELGEPQTPAGLLETVNDHLEKMLAGLGASLVSLKATFPETGLPKDALFCRFSRLVPAAGNRSGLVSITVHNHRAQLAALMQAVVKPLNTAHPLNP